MNSSATIDCDEPSPIDAITQAFLAEHRQGLRPDVEAYCQQHAEIAEELRSVLSAALFLEVAKPTTVESASIRNEKRSIPWERLGDYRLIREAGRGGMGVVYEAIQESLTRRVALKTLPNEIALSSTQLERFQREARAVASLHHTNIVPVFAVGEDQGVHYYVMPFINGTGLEQVLKELRALAKHDSKTSRPSVSGPPTGPMATHSDDQPSSVTNASLSSSAADLSNAWGLVGQLSSNSSSRPDSSTVSSERRGYWYRVARIGLQVADALEYASAQGVLHRDIKPSNLLLDTDGIVWVTDFGLAKIAESDDLTRTGEMLGTLRYLAPERMHGVHDIRGDIYGLGVTLYELLTLHVPFVATHRAELTRQILESEPPRPRSIDPRIPIDLETIVQKSMAKDPRDRYQTPGAMADDLRLFIADRPILSRQISAAEVVWRWCKKNPGIATLLLSVASLVMVIAVGGVLWGRSLQVERNASLRSELVAKESEEKAISAKNRAVLSEALASEARRTAEASDRQRKQDLFNVYLSDMEACSRSEMNGHRVDGIQFARSALEALPLAQLTPTQQARLLNATTACLSHADVDMIARYPINNGLGNAVSVDPNLEVWAVEGEHRQTLLKWRDGSRPDEVLTLDSIPGVIQASRWFSPCGRWIVESLNPGNGDYIIRVWDWHQTKLMLTVTRPLMGSDPCFDPNGRCIYLVENSVIHRYDVPTGKLLKSSLPRFRNSNLVIRHDGKFLASLIPRNHPTIVDAETLEVVATIEVPDHCNVAAWSPAESNLLIGTTDARIWQWNQVDQTLTLVPDRYPSQVSSITFSPSGRFVAIGTQDGNSHIRETALHRQIVVVPGKVIRFSEDDRRIAVWANNEVSIQELVPSPSLTLIKRPVQSAEFSADGNWIALSGSHGVQIYSTNPPSLQCDLGLDETGPVAWHPEGRELATFGMFSHLCRWPMAVATESGDLAIGPPNAVSLNMFLARIGADNQIPQHWGRHSVWHPDAKRLFYADSRKSHLWQFDTETNTKEVLADLPSASHLAISPDGKRIAGASWPVEQVVVLNTATRECVLKVPGCGRVAFSHDGKILAMSSRNDVRLLKTATWEMINSWPTDTMNSMHSHPIAFQPGGHLFAAAISEHCVRLFDSSTGEPVVDLPTNNNSDINWLSFSPDGARLAVTRTNCDVLIWNLYALRNEIGEFGMTVDALPATESIAVNHHVQSLDRGKILAPPNGWWSGHEVLARFEALQMHFPDAIDRMDTALKVASRIDSQTRAGLLIQRGQYHLLNRSPDAAAADFAEAVSLYPDEPVNVRRLVDLLLFGPSEIRNTESAALLLHELASQDESISRDRLNLVLALIQLKRLRAAREVFEQIDVQTIANADTISRLAYQCERCFFLRQRSPMNNDVLADEFTQELAESEVLVNEARKSAVNTYDASVDMFSELLRL